ncbi:MAG: hypothetical protein ABW148_04700 [Sedimenticola sp.]
MDIPYFFIAAFLILLLYVLYLNIIATLVLHHCKIFSYGNKVLQFLFVWLLPVIGAVFALRMLADVDDKALPKKWIPWPFRKAVFSAPRGDYKYRQGRNVPWFFSRR